ncbi:MAG: SprT-like domain-containing protein [Gemmatimonadota bacterium]
MTDTANALEFAHNMLRHHGLAHVPVEVSRRARSRLGAAKFKRGKPHMLQLSAWVVERAPWEVVREAILHEVAHLIAGHAAGHGPAWKRAALIVGCEPKRCADAEVLEYAPKPKWKGECCGLVWKRHRLTSQTRRGLCSKCRTPIVWQEVGTAA